MLRLEFNLSVISPRGENWSLQMMCCKVHVSRLVNNFGRPERFSGIAKPVFLYLLIVSFTVLIGTSS